MEIPKTFTIFRDRKQDLPPHQVRSDIIAGLIVAIIALPLSIALAIASGVSPEKGLITAIVAGFLISFLGGSRVQIGGPTGAFVVVVFDIQARHGFEGLTVATLLAGVMIIIMGMLQFGSVIKFIPITIVTGFTSGIALTLLSTQVKDFLGLRMQEVPSEFIEKWVAYLKHLGTINLYALGVGLFTLLIILLWPKVNKVLPGSLIGLIASTVLVTVLKLPVDTIGSTFGEIPGKIEFINLAALDFSLGNIRELMMPALTIAFLGSIESLLSAVVADGMIGKKHRSNIELIGQGVANIASALFGGIPATGAIARTAANVRSGGRTPLSGMVHSLVLLIILFSLMPLAKLIPMATLAAILVMVAYNMSHIKNFMNLVKTTRSDALVLLTTFTLTVIFDLVVAIIIGIMLQIVLFVRKMAEADVLVETNPFAEDTDLSEQVELPKQIVTYDLRGPLFFGGASRFLDTLEQIHSDTRVIIFDMKFTLNMDATGLSTFEKIVERCAKDHILVYLVHVPMKVEALFERSGLLKKIGRKHIFQDKHQAVEAAVANLYQMK